MLAMLFSRCLSALSMQFRAYRKLEIGARMGSANESPTKSILNANQRGTIPTLKPRLGIVPGRRFQSTLRLTSRPIFIHSWLFRDPRPPRTRRAAARGSPNALGGTSPCRTAPHSGPESSLGGPKGALATSRSKLAFEASASARASACSDLLRPGDVAPPLRKGVDSKGFSARTLPKPSSSLRGSTPRGDGQLRPHPGGARGQTARSASLIARRSPEHRKLHMICSKHLETRGFEGF